MKKYLPVLGIFLLLPLFFFQDSKLKVFETQLSRVGDKYFNELAGVIPSDKLFYTPVYKIKGKNYSVEQSENDPDGINYLSYLSSKDKQGRLDLDCDKYSNVYGLRCYYLRYVAGEDSTTVIDNMGGVVIDEPMSLFFYAGYLNFITQAETGISFSSSDFCFEYSQFDEVNEPITLCDKYFDSRLKQFCTDDYTPVISISKLKIQTADDFFCYYRAYAFLENAGV